MGRLWKLCTVPAGVVCDQAGSPSSLLDLRYGYDAVGNITGLRDKTGGADELQSFTYDALDRLTEASGPYNQSYSYNAIGNITYRSDVGAYSYSSGRPHAVTAAGSHSYGYDENGNMISRDGDSLTYDAENRLQSVTSGSETISFTYDGDGRRVLRDTITETIAYAGPHYELRFDKLPMVEDMDDDCQVTVIDIMRVAARWGQAGGPEDVNNDGTVDVGDVQQVAGRWRETCHVLAETVKYYALGGRRVAMRKDGTLYYLFGDHLGSTSVSYRTSDSQTITQRYYPWGTIRPGPNNTLPTDYTFTGQKLDEPTGLMYYGARYYKPAIGRFIQPDTIVPEPGNPQDLNRYSYVRNNPLRYTDPTGHCVTPMGVPIPGCMETVMRLAQQAEALAVQYGPQVTAFLQANIDKLPAVWDWLVQIAREAGNRIQSNAQGGNTADPGGLDPNKLPEFLRYQHEPTRSSTDPWASYQRFVTGRDYEEVWQLSNGRTVQLDAIIEDWVVEAKWAGQNAAAWQSSPLHPSKYFDAAGTLDQLSRQIQFAQEMGLKGIRWAVSNEAASAFYRDFIQTHFPELYRSGFIQVFHVPGSGM